MQSHLTKLFAVWILIKLNLISIEIAKYNI